MKNVIFSNEIEWWLPNACSVSMVSAQAKLFALETKVALAQLVEQGLIWKLMRHVTFL